VNYDLQITETPSKSEEKKIARIEREMELTLPRNINGRLRYFSSLTPGGGDCLLRVDTDPRYAEEFLSINALPTAATQESGFETFHRLGKSRNLHWWTPDEIRTDTALWFSRRDDPITKSYKGMCGTNKDGQFVLYLYLLFM
jgi:hypothetical protein